MKYPRTCLAVWLSLASFAFGDFYWGDPWHPMEPEGPGLTGISFNGSEFLVCGHQNTILRSSDGLEWEDQTQYEQYTYLLDVVFWNDRFIVGGDWGRLMETDTGAEQTPIPLSNEFYLSHIRKIVPVDGGLLLVTSFGLVLLDESWAGAKVYEGNVSDAAVAPFGLVALPGVDSQILRSQDGSSWEFQPTPFDVPPQAVAYGDGKMVAVGYKGRIWATTDGKNWAPHHLNVEAQLDQVVFEGGRFIAFGSEGAFFVSEDGIAWADVSLDHYFHVKDVSYGNNVYVAVADNDVILTSADGYSWARVGDIPAPYAFSDLSYDSGARRLVAYASEGRVLVWNYFDIPSAGGNDRPAGWESLQFEDVEWASLDSFSPRAIVGGDQGRFLKTTDWVEWELVETGLSDTFADVVFLNDWTALLVGSKGAIVRYFGPEQIEVTQIPGHPHLYSAATCTVDHVNIRFLAGSDDGVVWVSEPEGHWRAVNTGMEGPVRWLVEAYGVHYAGNESEIYRSFDFGEEWIKCDLPSSEAIIDMCGGWHHALMVLDSAGDLWQTSFGTAWRKLDNIGDPGSIGVESSRVSNAIYRYGDRTGLQTGIAGPEESVHWSSRRVYTDWWTNLKMGLFNPTYFPWIAHGSLGWMYSVGDFESDYFYSPTYGWMYTSHSLRPWFYLFDSNEWLHPEYGIWTDDN